MKIAMPVKRGWINRHFGRTREFAIVETDDMKIKIIFTKRRENNYEHLVNILKNADVKVVIAGSIGIKASQILKDNGFNVITGAKGGIAEVARDFIKKRSVS